LKKLALKKKKIRAMRDYPPDHEYKPKRKKKSNRRKSRRRKKSFRGSGHENHIGKGHKPKLHTVAIPLIIASGVALVLLIFYWRIGATKVEKISRGGVIHRVEFHSKNLRAGKKMKRSSSWEEKKDTEPLRLQNIDRMMGLSRPLQKSEVVLPPPSEQKVVERDIETRGPKKLSTVAVNTAPVDIEIVNRPHPDELGGTKPFDVHSVGKNTNLYPPQVKNTQPIIGNHRSNKPVVISLAYGYDHEHDRRFVGTLRETGYTGDIVIGLEPNINPRRKLHRLQYFIMLDVVVYTVDLGCNAQGRCVWKGLEGKDTDRLFPRPLELIKYSFFREVLKKYITSTPVLLTDYRDVFFQAKPFTMIESVKTVTPSLWVFQEEYRSSFGTLGTSSYNADLITRCWGSVTLESWKDLPIHNAGLQMGCQSAVVVFTDLMLQLMRKFKCAGGGQDQGYFNYLLQKGLAYKRGIIIRSWERGFGPVNNLALLKDLSTSLGDLSPFLTLDEDGMILNTNSTIPSPIIHKWNVFRDDMEELLKDRGVSFKDAAANWASRELKVNRE